MCHVSLKTNFTVHFHQLFSQSHAAKIFNYETLILLTAVETFNIFLEVTNCTFI